MDSYETYTKEELIKEICALKRLHKELIKTFHETERMEFSWSGNLGQWFWDYERNEVTYNPLKAEALGYKKDELPEKLTYQFFTEKIHPDDYSYVMEKMRMHLSKEVPVWEVKYRIQAKDGSWRVYLDRGKVTDRDESGKPLFLKGIVFDVTEDELEREGLMESNTTLKNKIKIDSLTSLYTKSATLLELGKRVNKSKRLNHAFSLILLRVDIFTQYEERFSPVLSEETLKLMGDVISSVINETSIAGHYRENVFMLVLENVSPEEAYEVAETIRNQAIATFFSLTAKLVVSAGVAPFHPSDTISKLLEKATEKLLAAQRKGGNNTVI